MITLANLSDSHIRWGLVIKLKSLVGYSKKSFTYKLIFIVKRHFKFFDCVSHEKLCKQYILKGTYCASSIPGFKLEVSGDSKSFNNLNVHYMHDYLNTVELNV